MVWGEEHVGVPGAHVPHRLDLVRLAAAADGDRNAESLGSLPESIAARIVGLGLTLESHARHAALVHPIRQQVRGIGRSRVQYPHRNGAWSKPQGTVALVGVVKTVGAVGLNQGCALHTGLVHLGDQVLNVVADLGGPSSRAGV